MNEKCLLLGFEMIKLDKTTGEERRLTSKKKGCLANNPFRFNLRVIDYTTEGLESTTLETWNKPILRLR